MVGMDQVVCRECVEVVFIDHSMVYDHVVLQFRGGKSVRILESTSNETHALRFSVGPLRRFAKQGKHSPAEFTAADGRKSSKN